MTARESKPLGRTPAKGTGPIPPALADSPDYEVIREINRGGMGVVYLVRNRRMDRLEALKVVRHELLRRDGALERFEREMRSAARLNHTNIVTAYSSPPLVGLVAFAMEFVEGTDLHQLVKSRGPLPVANACYYIQQAALGLQHALEREMVHRDIKPGNLMLTRNGKRQVVKILDFGLAKATSENQVEAGLTSEGQMLGTPLYMAPEQIKGAATADIRADIYSLGCTLYFLLTGAPPFNDKSSLYDILQAHQLEQPRPLNEVRPEIPAELAAIASRMTAKDPAERYQQPSDVARALAPFFKQGVKPLRGDNACALAPDTATTNETNPAGEGAPKGNAGSPGRSKTAGRMAGGRGLMLWGAAVVGVLFVGGLGLWVGQFGGTQAINGPGNGREPDPDSPPALPSGFISLFNGRDLTGWKVTRDDYQAWRVEEGAIAVSCANWKSASVLYSERRYANYRLRLEFKVDPGARCRFVPRFRDGDKHVGGDPAQAGVAIMDDEYSAAHPEIRGSRHTGSFLVSRDFKNHVAVDRPAELRPAESWNLMEIEVRAQALSLDVNGVPVLRTHLDELAARENAFPGLRQTFAPIGLEGATGTVRFRNIAVEELPPTPPDRNLAAESEFSSLFNGLDLTGWKVVDLGKKDKKSHWRLSNGAISGSAPGGKNPPVFLASDREFGEYVLRFEFRKTREPARCNIVYHGAGKARDAVILWNDNQPEGTAVGALRYASGKIRHPLDHAPPNGLDEWNQAELAILQGELRVVINGIEVQRAATRAGEKSDGGAGSSPGRARIGLTIFDGEMEFRKIQIAEK